MSTTTKSPSDTTHNRIVMPILMPLGILAAIAGFVGLFAFIMLYNTRLGAVALASVMASGILAAMSLAASADTLGPRQKAGVAIAGLAPILFGFGLAVTGGGVDDESLVNINAQPHGPSFDGLPAGHGATVTAGADSGLEFDQTTVTLPAQGEVGINFVNQQAVTHNLFVYASAADFDANGTPIAFTSTFQAGQEAALWTAAGEADLFFICTIHPSTMRGTVALVEGAEASAA